MEQNEIKYTGKLVKMIEKIRTIEGAHNERCIKNNKQNFLFKY